MKPASSAHSTPTIVSHSAPPGTKVSQDYEVTVDAVPVFIHAVRVREKTVNLPGISLLTHAFDGETQLASMGLFDFSGSVTVKIKVLRPFKTVEIVPASLGITPKIEGIEVSFVLHEPRPVTLLLDGALDAPLHLLTHRPEENPPTPNDPNVIYFGPGVHETGPILPKSGQTVYLASGAIVRSKLQPGEKGTVHRFGLIQFDQAAIHLDGVENVRIRGRGILDCELIPHPARNSIVLNQCRGIDLEGITLLDAAGWNILIGSSRDVTVSGVGIISGRLNSDGINTVGSSNVRVSRCFVRNHDDSLAVKTTSPDHPAENVRYEDCTLWSDWGFSIGPTYETRAPIRDVTFRNIDIIASRHWPIGVMVNDSATVEDIRFEDIRIANCSRHPDRDPNAAWINLSISKSSDWSTDAGAGRIRNVTLERISLEDTTFPTNIVEAHGFDTAHQIEGVVFRDITLNGKPAQTREALQLNHNAFVQGVTIESTST